jgi:hypothetical protein
MRLSKIAEKESMRPLISLCALSLVSLSMLACGSANDRPDPSISRLIEPISGGQTDSYHTSVLGMFTMSNYGGGMCSATLIAPNLVLTARHCIAPILGDSEYVICGQSAFGSPYAGNNIYVTNDQEMTQYSDNWWQGSEVRVPAEGNDTCGFDVALVILAQNVPESVTVPYVPRIDIEPTQGEVYQAVGYGTTATGGGGIAPDAPEPGRQRGFGAPGIESTEAWRYRSQAISVGADTKDKVTRRRAVGGQHTPITDGDRPARLDHCRR